MNIRKATLDDVENNLANIFIDGFKFHLNGRPDIFSSDKTEEDLKSELISIVKNEESVLVAEENNIICGFIIFQIKNKQAKTMWIDQLVVDKNSRGQGIAKMLINKVYEIAMAENCQRIEFCCWNFNDNANEMYKHLGFSEQRTVFEQRLK